MPLLSKLWGWLAGALAVVVGLFLWGKSKKSEGAQEAMAEIKEKQLDKHIELLNEAKEIEDNNAQLSDNDVRRVLFEKHGRGD